MKLISYLLSLLLFITISPQLVAAPQQAAMARNGLYVGLSFGYLLTDYDTALNRYANSAGNRDAAGSTYAFGGKLGYNFTKVYGVQLEGFNYQDSADGSSNNITRKASMDLDVADIAAVFHLKLNDSRSWIATPKVGLAYESAKLNYQYIDSAGNTQPPWEGSTTTNDNKRESFIVPTVGIEFDHSFDSHWIMAFGYQYFFEAGKRFDDPYKTTLSSIHYFSVGGIYKF